MRLEDEIKQEKFKNEFLKVRVSILYTANWLSHHYERDCKKYGITPEQFNILRILRGQKSKPITINLLIERMLNKTSNVSRLVEKLRKKDLVERSISEADRRACDVLITQKGLDLLVVLDKAEIEWDQLISHMPESEVKLVSELLDKLRK